MSRAMTAIAINQTPPEIDAERASINARSGMMLATTGAAT
jgi:hypothetical protein